MSDLVLSGEFEDTVVISFSDLQTLMAILNKLGGE